MRKVGDSIRESYQKSKKKSVFKLKQEGLVLLLHVLKSLHIYVVAIEHTDAAACVAAVRISWLARLRLHVLGEQIFYISLLAPPTLVENGLFLWDLFHGLSFLLFGSFFLGLDFLLFDSLFLGLDFVLFLDIFLLFAFFPSSPLLLRR